MILATEKVTIRHGHLRIERERDPSVRVPDIMLNCVGFVGEVTHHDSSGAVEGDLHATGFFVSVPFGKDGGPPSLVYFVTAKHVAADLRDKEVYLLVNKIGGGITTMPTVTDRWYLHPTDPTADVAVIQVGDPHDADIKAVHIKSLGVPPLLEKLDIGIGDEVFAIGLFTPVAGSARNEAIVRHGNIAMMPQEQIQTELGYADVYLVEARSIGGLSGCPVFVRPTIQVPRPTSDPHTRNAWAVGHGTVLLGLMHGHWDIKESEMNKAFITHDRKRGVNLGIGIVVPALKILETINRPEFQEMRKQLEQGLSRKSVPGVDSVRPREKEQASFRKEDFDAALKKASRRITPADKK
jgi:hypothetical protein